MARTRQTVAQLEQYIRRAARARGIDPDIAVRVARSEGLAPGVWQSNVRRGGRREPSYGPFQLLVGGPGTGHPAGMGNDFQRDTGLDPSDPSTVHAQIDYALDQASQGGWGPWYGARAVGIDRWEGIGQGGAQAHQVATLPGDEAPMPTMRPEPELTTGGGMDLAGLGALLLGIAPAHAGGLGGDIPMPTPRPQGLGAPIPTPTPRPVDYGAPVPTPRPAPPIPTPRPPPPMPTPRPEMAPPLPDPVMVEDLPATPYVGDSTAMYGSPTGSPGPQRDTELLDLLRRLLTTGGPTGPGAHRNSTDFRGY